MNRRPPRFSIAVPALALAGAACSYEPEPPVLRYSLSADTTRLDEAGDPVIPRKVQDHMLGALEMLFGTPSHPRSPAARGLGRRRLRPELPAVRRRTTAAAGSSARIEWTRSSPATSAASRTSSPDRRGRLRRRAACPGSTPDLAADWSYKLRTSGRSPRTRSSGRMRARSSPTTTRRCADSAELYPPAVPALPRCRGRRRRPDRAVPESRGRATTATACSSSRPSRTRPTPRRADLCRILDQGVTGTAMPSFRRFSQAELEGLVDYVRLLSIRGMVERDLRGHVRGRGAAHAVLRQRVLPDRLGELAEGGRALRRLRWRDPAAPRPSDRARRARSSSTRPRATAWAATATRGAATARRP